MGCVRTKLTVVAEDERDGGRRQVLNLGHTVGHAIEAATGYARYRHGEAVGIGLLAALRLSGREALRAEVADLLAARGLAARLRGRAGRGRARPGRARQEARRRSCALRVGGGAGRGDSRAPRRSGSVARGDRGGARAVRHRVIGAPRREPRRARPAAERPLRHAVADRARGARAEVRPRARPGRGLLSDQPRGRVLRVPPPGRRARPRAGAQPRGLDPLLVGDSRRSGGRRAAGGRGAPLRRRRARGVAAGVRDRLAVPGHGPGQGPRKLSRGARAAAHRARRDERARRPAGRADRRARARLPACDRPAERALAERFHRHQRGLSRHPRRAPVLHRLPLRRAGRARRWTASSAWRPAAT